MDSIKLDTCDSMDPECLFYRARLDKEAARHDCPVNCSNVEPEDAVYLFSCYLRAAFTSYFGGGRDWAR